MGYEKGHQLTATFQITQSEMTAVIAVDILDYFWDPEDDNFELPKEPYPANRVKEVLKRELHDYGMDGVDNAEDQVFLREHPANDLAIDCATEYAADAVERFIDKYLDPDVNNRGVNYGRQFGIL